MQVFKSFFKIVTRMKGVLITYTFIFLALAIGMSSMTDKDSGEKTFQEEKCTVTVFDYDKSDESEALKKYFESKMKIVSYEDDVEELRDHLFARSIEAVIYIKEGYGQALAEGKTEELLEVTTLPGTTYSHTVTNCIDRYMNMLNAYLAMDENVENALEKTQEQMDKKANVVMAGEETGEETEEGYSKLYFFMSYLPYVFAACFIQAIGLVISRFQEKEIRSRMDVSSCSFKKRNGSLWLGILVSGFGFAVLFVLIGVCMYGSEIFTRDGLLMLLNVAVSVLWGLALTYLVSTVVRKESSLGMAGTISALMVGFLGGMFVPLAYMGDGIKMLCHFIPSYWYITALEMIDKGQAAGNMGELFAKIGIQVVFAAALFCIGLSLAAKKRRTH